MASLAVLCVCLVHEEWSETVIFLKTDVTIQLTLIPNIMAFFSVQTNSVKCMYLFALVKKNCVVKKIQTHKMTHLHLLKPSLFHTYSTSTSDLAFIVERTENTLN